MTQITLNGKTFNIAHHLGAEMSYYDLAEKNLDPTDIFGGEGKEPNPTALVKLLTAQIISNDQTEELSIEADIMRNPSRKEIQEALNSAMREFFIYNRIPVGAETHVAEPSTNEAEEEDDEKKA